MSHLQILLWDVRMASGGIDRKLAELDVSKLSEGCALEPGRHFHQELVSTPTTISTTRRSSASKDSGAIDLPQEIAGYKPRPLDGVWATPPFLHNGSVPTLYQMLLPPEQRDEKFFVGRREFDPLARRFRDARPMPMAMRDGFWLDTTLAGNPQHRSRLLGRCRDLEETSAGPARQSAAAAV